VTPSGVTGDDTQTGNFSIGLTHLVTGKTPGDSSTYSVSDNIDESWTSQLGCHAHLTGSFSGSGSLAWLGNGSNAELTIGFTVHPNITYAVWHIQVPYTETQTTVWTGPPGSGCNTTTTGTVHSWIIPGCYGEIDVLKGKYPSGTVNLDCSHQDASGTSNITGSLSVSPNCVPPNQLSGPDWADQFPTSRDVSTLADPFRQNVILFINAMQQAGITPPGFSVNATRRPLQRQYLMRYSWLIWKSQIDPKNVPKFSPPAGQAPVNICWVHTNSSGAEDLPASVAAATQMVNAFNITGLKVAPPVHSLHTDGLAIDMNTNWSQSTITIVDGSGHDVTINTTPHSGLNAQLMAVGLTYGVHHYCYPAGTCSTSGPAADAIHWSVNGH
jgi:hypothetical protein